jgi:hypothetical protein
MFGVKEEKVKNEKWKMDGEKWTMGMEKKGER